MPELSIRLGQVFLTLRNYERAKSAFTRTLAMAPNAANALWGLGKTYQSLGENKQAAEYFRRALALSPGDPGILLNLGHSLLEIGELDAGYDCFRQAAAGDRNRYAAALATLVKAGRGRFWLKPSAAAKFLLGETR